MSKLLPLLEELPGQKQLPPKRRIGSVTQFAVAFPQAVEVMMDGVERPVRRSEKKRAAQALPKEKEEARTQSDCNRG